MKTCPNCRALYPNHFAVCPQDGIPLFEADDWSVGTVVRGKYRILGKIGQGRMGAVYKALHTKFDQVRALKVMTLEMAADSDFVKRFEREAVLMSKLQHLNVVRVDDIDETEDGRPFIVMEFVEGRSLRHVIQDEGPLTPLRVCAIGKQAAAGLGAAHLLGMVHRDVKPDNIVLLPTPSGEIAKVLDFGIAKLKEVKLTDSLSTATGMVIGTPQYLSPEQAMGKRSEELDGRSDLYSLGLVFYQMLTCGLPFQADSAVGWMMARLNAPPRPIQLVRPDLGIPDPLAKLVMRCLEKERHLRPADAAALISEIEHVEEQIRRSIQPVAPVNATVPEPVRLVAEPTKFTKRPRATATRATSTAPWAGGWRFYAGLALIVFLPFAPGLLSEFLPFGTISTLHAETAAVTAAICALGWWLATRKHWSFRLAALLPFGLIVVVSCLLIYDSIQHPGYRDADAHVKISIGDLKKADRSPLEISPLTLGVSTTGQTVFKFTLQNIASDARVTDWKSHTLLLRRQRKTAER